MKLRGFTLAEVLITLGIIGVVAALTIPGLIETYQKVATAQKLKETYSIIVQAAKLHTNETGLELEGFDTRLNGREFLDTYFAPYMKVIQRCTTVKACYHGENPLSIDRKRSTYVPEYILVLLNGAYVGVSSMVPGVLFYIDINGAKKPNLSGRDIFYFYLINTDTLGNDEGCQDALDRIKNNLKPGIYPGSYDSCYIPHAARSRSALLGVSVHRSCNRNANHLSMGDACAAVIMKDGWKISKDYPW